MLLILLVMMFLYQKFSKSNINGGFMINDVYVLSRGYAALYIQGRKFIMSISDDIKEILSVLDLVDTKLYISCRVVDSKFPIIKIIDIASVIALI